MEVVKIAQYVARAGVDTYVLYGDESTYNTVAGTIQSGFGLIQSVRPSKRRNLIGLAGYKGSEPTTHTAVRPNEVRQFISTRFEAGLTLEFQPWDFTFLQYVLGSVDGAGTAASKFTYPMASASSAANKKLYYTPPSISISTNFMFAGAGDNADKQWHYLGSIVNSCTIRGAIGEPITVTLEFLSGKIDGDVTLETQQANDTSDIYYFVGNDIEYPTSSSIPNIIDSFDLTINNNGEILVGLRSIIGKHAIWKRRDITLTVTVNAEGTNFMDDFLGNATTLQESATKVATLLFNLAGGTNHTADITLTNLKLDEDNMEETYPDVVPERLNLVAESIYCIEQTSA